MQLRYSGKLVEYFKHSTGENIRGDLNLQNQLSSITEDHKLEREKQWKQNKSQLLIAENNNIREDLDNLVAYVYTSDYISGKEKLTTLIEHVMH
jgi:hypothetical protein